LFGLCIGVALGLPVEGVRRAVLRAVNLGGDADTTGSVAGGLAGTFYGFNAIPKRWVEGVCEKGGYSPSRGKIPRMCHAIVSHCCV